MRNRKILMIWFPASNFGFYQVASMDGNMEKEIIVSG